MGTSKFPNRIMSPFSLQYVTSNPVYYNDPYGLAVGTVIVVEQIITYSPNAGLFATGGAAGGGSAF